MNVFGLTKVVTKTFARSGGLSGSRCSVHVARHMIHEDPALGAMDEANLEGVTMRLFVSFELKPNKSIDQSARELKLRKRTAVDEKLWPGGSRGFRVKVGDGGHEVDGASRALNPLPKFPLKTRLYRSSPRSPIRVR